MSETKIKICGITNIEDALIAKEAGADFIGFILYPSSPRYVLPETALEIRKEVGSELKVVGVFVNEDRQKVIELQKTIGLDFLQFHGDEDDGYCRDFPLDQVIKVVRIDDNPQILTKYEQSDFKYILLDKFSKVRYGGTGQVFDWTIASDFVSKFKGKVFVSGGLNPQNVCEAIKALHPYAVDASSGVEKEPGRKDPDKVREFVRRVREAENR